MLQDDLTDWCPVQMLELNMQLSNKSWVRFIIGSSLSAGLLLIPSTQKQGQG